MKIKNELKAKCFNHFERESVALCTTCKKPFCRECVSFYDEKMTCSHCIKVKIKNDKKKFSGQDSIFSIGMLLLFLVIGWSFFYILGSFLANIPSELSN